MNEPQNKSTLAQRIPFFYGWIVVAVAFVTMAIGVNSRTSFSLLVPPLLEEFQWDRATVSATFSIGFVTSVVLSPLVGALMDKFGPRFVIPAGATVTALGFLTSTLATKPWHLYLTLGLFVVGGGLFINYIGHTVFLPNWFSKRRGLAVGIAFSGVGVGSITLFPWMQHSIETIGWRETNIALGILILVVIVPLNALFQRRRPEDMGLLPDGASAGTADETAANQAQEDARIVDKEWTSVEWTLSLAVRTSRYWWLVAAFVTGLWAWYSVQVHQTQFLLDIGISGDVAATALGLVPLAGIAGQIMIGHFSDRMGREWGWSVALFGYVLTYLLLLLLELFPSEALIYTMVAAQGVLGYGLASVFGAVGVELFAGKKYGVIFGTLGAFAGVGAAVGPLATGWLFDLFGNYNVAFAVAAAVSSASIVFMWLAGPRKVRLVAGRVPKG